MESLQRIDLVGFGSLLAQLQAEGYTLIGPRLEAGTIDYGAIEGPDDLPIGWRDEQSPGRYRTLPRNDRAHFGFNATPASFKTRLHRSEETVLEVQRGEQGELRFVPVIPAVKKQAWIGARSCELAALAIQDRVLKDSADPDPRYAARREGVFIVAVHCGQAGGTCFCTSMNAGPKAEGGFDLALTEILDGPEHHFVVETGSDAGAALLERIPHSQATAADLRRAADAIEHARATMGRHLDTDGLKTALYAQAQHPGWEEVADRCLACGNCTAACPTCFCSSYEDQVELDGANARRTRHWDSCFNADFTHLAGGPVRASTPARYRQWLTHKLASWHDQFGTSGCVGCGRCITWCPVGIDITAEASRIRQANGEPSK